MASRIQANSSQQGAALLLVVWVVALLTLLAASALQLTRTSAHTATAALDRLRDEAVADGAINLAILNLSEPTGGQPWRVDGSEHSLQLAGQTVSVRVWDEAGKVDVNRGDEDLLKKILASHIEKSGNGQQAIQSVLDYRKQQLMQNAAAPFRSLDELAAAGGLSLEAVPRMERDLTCYSGAPGVDARYASNVVANALSSPFQVSPLHFESSSNNSFAGRAFLIQARVRNSASEQGTHAVVRSSGDSTHPALVSMWERES